MVGFYVKTGTNHFSLAFTYDCLAAGRLARFERPFVEFIDIGPPDDGVWLPLTPYDLMGGRWGW